MNPSSDIECAVVTNPIDSASCSLSVPFATEEVHQFVGSVTDGYPSRLRSMGRVQATPTEEGRNGLSNDAERLAARPLVARRSRNRRLGVPGFRFSSHTWRTRDGHAWPGPLGEPHSVVRCLPCALDPG